MGKIIVTTINRFDGGVTNDPRDPAANVARASTNFDIVNRPHKLTSYRDSESGDTSASTSQKQNFCVALLLPLSTNVYRLFSLGVKSGANTAEVLMKDISTGGSSDLGDGGWLTPANNQSSSGATAFDLFVYYQKTGLIYGAKGLNRFWAFDPKTGAAWNDNALTLTYTNVAQGLVHSADDILYIPHDTQIEINNNGSWSTAAAQIDSGHYLTSICQFGNLIAEAGAPLSGVGNSRVWLWDRDSSTSTFVENIDWGPGILKVVEEVGGQLIGISLLGGATQVKDKIIFRRWIGQNRSEPFLILEADNASSVLAITKQKVNDRLHFTMRVKINGTIREGVWSLSKNSLGTFVLAHERTPNNDTALGNGALKGFFSVNDYMFIAYTNNAGTYGLSKTNDSSSYTATATYETPILNAGDSSAKKKLVGVSLMTEPLPAGAQATVKYRTDATAAGTYTSICKSTTTGAIDKSVVNADTDLDGVPDANLPEYNEIDFRLESTGGAEITALSFMEEITGKSPFGI